MKHKNIILTLTVSVVVLLAGFPPLFGGDPARVGTAGGMQLQVPVGARDLAMGGANVANSSELEAIYWNPAGLATMQNNAQVQFSTMTIFTDIRVNYLALAAKFGRLGTIGFSLKAFDFGDIPFTTIEDMDGKSGRTFSPTFVTTGLTYSKRLTERIQIGVNGKLIYESIPRLSATTFAFDAGLQYHELGGIHGLSFGVALKNIGGSLQYKGSGLIQQGNLEGTIRTGDFVSIPSAKNELPASVELGLGYVRNINEENMVLFAGRFLNNNFSHDAYNLGVEYSYKGMFSLRAGYNYQPTLDSEYQEYRFTAGAGVNLQLGNTTLVIDYAFRDSQYFNGNNMFSLKIGF